jgi:dimethylhistidine N-methyltransferase
MSEPAVSTFALHDLEPAADDFLAEVLEGLSRPRKELSCKFFYDRRGSELFDEICRLDEYYLTRTELSILFRQAAEIGALLGRDCLLIEYGSGSSLKTRILLDHLDSPAGYVPIDISREHLLAAVRGLKLRHPRLHVMPVCADYTAQLTLPKLKRSPASKVVFFPGSTIGNFEPAQARKFLSGVRELAGAGSGLLIGVDLKKDPTLLHAAYNDASGVTAEFNLNLLARINRELDGDFEVERFAHYAFYNPTLGRVEMHLVSLAKQTAQIGGRVFEFARGESIFTESSYKHTIDGFCALAAQAGYERVNCWTDAERLFAVVYRRADGPG